MSAREVRSRKLLLPAETNRDVTLYRTCGLLVESGILLPLRSRLFLFEVLLITDGKAKPRCWDWSPGIISCRKPHAPPPYATHLVLEKPPQPQNILDGPTVPSTPKMRKIDLFGDNGKRMETTIVYSSYTLGFRV